VFEYCSLTNCPPFCCKSNLELMRQLESVYLVVYNDHVPSERQYTMQKQIEMRSKAFGISAEAAEKKLKLSLNNFIVGILILVIRKGIKKTYKVIELVCFSIYV